MFFPFQGAELKGQTLPAAPCMCRGIWSASGSAPGPLERFVLTLGEKRTGGCCSAVGTISTIVKCRRAERHEDLPQAANICPKCSNTNKKRLSLETGARNVSKALSRF